MCTILSFDKDTFRQNEEVLVSRILQDAMTNDDGSALIIQGKQKQQVSLLRTLDAATITSLLIADDNWVRAWVHNRAATTSFKGLIGTHGFHGRFEGKDWYVMHNGRFSHTEANRFNVDSEWMANLTQRYGPLAAIEAVKASESWANVFLICPTEGVWYMLRQTGGSLHTDGNGNFSTHKIGGLIEVEVPIRTCEEYKFTVAEKEYKSYHNGYTREYGGMYGTEEKKTSGIIGPTRTVEPSDMTKPTGEIKLDKKGDTWHKCLSGLWLRTDKEVTYVRKVVD